MSDKPINCPTCGCPVKVGGKGTTKYYVPTRSEAADALLSAAKKAKESQGWDGNNPDDDRWRNLYSELRKAISAYEEKDENKA